MATALVRVLSVRVLVPLAVSPSVTAVVAAPMAYSAHDARRAADEQEIASGVLGTDLFPPAGKKGFMGVDMALALSWDVKNAIDHVRNIAGKWL